MSDNVALEKIRALSEADLIALYLRARDAKQEMERRHKEELARYTVPMEYAQNELMDRLNSAGGTSIKTPHGTAYKTTRTSATVGDWDATLTYIRENSRWDMLERRVSKEAVEQFVQQYQDLPPGVNYSAVQVVNIRRS